MEINRSKIICELEEELKNNDKVIIYYLENEEFLEKIVKKLENKQSNIRIWSVLRIKKINRNIRIISYKEAEEILRLFYLYEFTNRLIMFTESSGYPNIMNYVEQGIMTEEQVIDALFYKYL